MKFDEDFMSADVWEIYKISMDQPIINNYLGAWSENDGLNMTTLEKYQRRSDLMVINFFGTMWRFDPRCVYRIHTYRLNTMFTHFSTHSSIH